MTKYLFEANYVGEGIKGLMREGERSAVMRSSTPSNPWEDRSNASTTLSGSGTCWGVFEVPAPADAAALSLMINSSGSVNVRLKPLLTPEDLDDAAKKTPTYRPPGQ